MATLIFSRQARGIFAYLLFLLIAQSSGLNILVNAILGKGSHFYLSASISEQLVKRGYNITYLVSNAFEDRIRDGQYGHMFHLEVFTHPIPVVEVHEMFDNLSRLAFSPPDPMKEFKITGKLVEARKNDCDALLNDEKLLSRLRSSNFSAVMYDMTWLCGAIIAEELGIPLFAVCPFPNPCMVTESAGSVFNPSFLPVFAAPFSNKMTFYQRLINAIMYVLVSIAGRINFLDIYSNITEIYGKSPTEMYEQSKLWLVNSDFAGEYPCALSPNVISVGGLTTRDPRPLPPDLEDFVQGSGIPGIIVCSFGSFLNMTDEHISAFQIFTRVFGRLPQRVVWQVAGKLSFPIPPNVKTLPWLPMNDLLGHPKTKALFYHGGQNTYYEAIYHGVPTVVMPVYGDQKDNAMRSVHLGFGLTLSTDFTEDELYTALRTITANGSYSETASRMSGIFRDRPMRPAQRAAFWIDHVIKHGSNHMGPLENLNVVQYYLLDVIAFVLLVAGTTMYGIVKCVTIGCRMLCCRQVVKVKAD
ncbi:UDP-glucuronosyltransferase 2B31-like [Diadema antillarum]|uniref:UDP-glucuronosyltransferase 2B31-like n=1 Tax=Diadema antillarum TaxID=105358 RepID=UPI003A842514